MCALAFAADSTSFQEFLCLFLFLFDGFFSLSKKRSCLLFVVVEIRILLGKKNPDEKTKCVGDRNDDKLCIIHIGNGAREPCYL